MKEFFKPSIAKIALMLLIPLYFAVEVGVEKVGLTATNVELTHSLLLFPLPYVVVFFSALAVIGSTSIDTSNWQWADFSIWQKGWGIILEFIVPLIISYLLACLIVYLFRKIRKREAKNIKSTPQQ